MTAMYYSGGCGVYVCEDAGGGGGGVGAWRGRGRGRGGGLFARTRGPVTARSCLLHMFLLHIELMALQRQQNGSCDNTCGVCLNQDETLSQDL